MCALGARRGVPMAACEGCPGYRAEARRRPRKAHARGDDESVALALASDAPAWTHDDDFARIEGVRLISADRIEAGRSGAAMHDAQRSTAAASAARIVRS